VAVRLSREANWSPCQRLINLHTADNLFDTARALGSRGHVFEASLLRKMCRCHFVLAGPRPHHKLVCSLRDRFLNTYGQRSFSRNVNSAVQLQEFFHAIPIGFWSRLSAAGFTLIRTPCKNPDHPALSALRRYRQKTASKNADKRTPKPPWHKVKNPVRQTDKCRKR